MLRSKFNAALFVTDRGFVGVNAEESDLTNNDLYIGMPVKIDCNRILSHNTRGKITGFQKNLNGTLLAKVHWLDGAPPLMIKCEYIKSMLPRKSWALVQYMPDAVTGEEISELTNFSTGEGYWNAGRGIYGRRFFNREAAVAKAMELSRRYNCQIMVMESSTLCNTTSELAL